MNIIIVGAGEVGQYLATILSHESHDIIIIDKDRTRLKEVEELLDIQVLVGNGADYSKLERANIANCDLLLSVTDDDEANIISAMAGKYLGAKRAVSRVRNQYYLYREKVPFDKLLGIDLIICPEVLVAFEIAKFLEHPGIIALEYFAKGKVQMRQIKIASESTNIINRPISQINLPKGVLIASITRGKKFTIPHGNNILKLGDVITVIGESDNVMEIQKNFRNEGEKAKNIVIAGASGIGCYLAQILESRPFSIKLMDSDKNKCIQASERLQKTTIINSDPTKLPFLKEERIDEADVFIAVTDDDEDNLMSSLLAKELGVKENIAITHRPDYASVIENIGINHVLSPRLVTANKILSLINRGWIKSMTILNEGKVEIFEIQVKEKSRVTNTPLKEIKFPQNSIVGVIIHNEKIYVPNGESKIQPGNTVIVFSTSVNIEEIEDLFANEKKI